ncbi:MULTISPECIES: CHAT domain-containing protein [Nostocales]|uniref:CHAT domain-containing protein n=3 Tax=Nostocales TaxID=1161 RepID=A0A8S9SWC3_9CYAN|nr:CHAT domain-containing protein [Tolypothrix bouteillei]KAF3884176.1 CHAT domain-containing protein [Tolypothrix bouteillei VB521301]
MDKVKILFLAADPSDSTRLRLGQELRNIREKLQLSKQRDNFVLESRESVRPGDVTQAIFDTEPQIVHFSGHGINTGELCFENVLGQTQPVQTVALANLFKLVNKQVKCVVLNACYSKAQARVIAEHIPYVIGMSQAIGDQAGITFAVGFYRALGAGRSFEDAYEFACVEIQLENIQKDLIPVLYKQESKNKTESKPNRYEPQANSSHPSRIGFNRNLQEFFTVILVTEKVFWLQWILFTSIGSAISFITSIHGIGSAFFGIVVGGIVTGVAQWWGLRKRIAKIFWWLLATPIGWVIGWAIGGSLIQQAIARIEYTDKFPALFQNEISFLILRVLLGAILFGVVLALAQWFVLRELSTKANWWIVFNPLGTAVSIVSGVIVSRNVDWITGAIVGGLVFGVITGSTILYLLHHPIHRGRPLI